MVRWWDEYGPPVYLSVAGYLGLVNPKKKTQTKTGKVESTDNEANLENLASMFSGAGGII